MISKYKHFLILILSVSVGFSIPDTLSSQELLNRSYFEVKLVDPKTGNPIIFANVLNAKRKWWIVTDTLGIARVAVYPGDTLTITSLGFSLLRYAINDSVINAPKPLIIKLKEKRYELKSVTFYALGTYEHFKYRVLHMSTPDKLENIKEQLKISKDKLPTTPLQEQMSIPLLSPFSLLYSLFSKEAKSKQKLLDVLEIERNTRFAFEKFNRNLVRKITGLNEIQLDEFMLKYRPSNEFLYTASEYDVINQIFKDFDHYKSTHKYEFLKDSINTDTIIKK